MKQKRYHLPLLVLNLNQSLIQFHFLLFTPTNNHHHLNYTIINCHIPSSSPQITSSTIEKPSSSPLLPVLTSNIINPIPSSTAIADTLSTSATTLPFQPFSNDVAVEWEHPKSSSTLIQMLNWSVCLQIFLSLENN